MHIMKAERIGAERAYFHTWLRLGCLLHGQLCSNSIHPSITLNPHLARAFQGGIPEVSVFWIDEHRIACKCRLDWLKPRTIVDIKKTTS